jgi:hypothetical protein
MAAQHLTVLSFPRFPQHFDRAFARFQGKIERVLTHTQLGQCSHESVESREGACDGGLQCSELAIVHDLGSDLAFCGKHFAGVSRA